MSPAFFMYVDDLIDSFSDVVTVQEMLACGFAAIVGRWSFEWSFVANVHIST